MTDLRHAGFFHLSIAAQIDPIDLLESALDESGLASLFGEALLILPEAFNIVGEYYGKVSCPPDPNIEARLKEISTRRGLCFVAGLVNCEGCPYSEAVLIDGDDRKVLTRKTLTDRSRCYEVFMQPCDEIILHRGLRLGALMCMDAAEGDNAAEKATQKKRHDAIRSEFAKWSETKLLCVPARFAASSPVPVARSWNQNKLSIIIANKGSATYPSVIHLDNGQLCIAPGNCKLQLQYPSRRPFIKEIGRFNAPG